MTDQSKYLEDPRLIETHYGEEYENYYNAIVLPVFLNSLNVFPSTGAYFDSDKNNKHAYVYGGVQNPTVKTLEDKTAALEHSTKAFVYSSGMAAATTVVVSACHVGTHIVCIRNVYGPLNTFLTQYCKEHFQMNVTFVKGDPIEELEDAVAGNTDLTILESPSSIVMSLQDISEVIQIARKHNAKVYIDNVYCTPTFQNLLDLGVDIVMHIMSKYIGGHSDIIDGVLIASDEDLLKKLMLHRELYGGILGPMEAWLIIRGLCTIEVHLRQHEKDAVAVVAFLDKHPRVKTVNYPGLPSFPQYDLMKKQQKDNCGLTSFEVDSTMEQTKKFCQAPSIFKAGVSWGGFESLVEMSYARMTDQEVSWLGASINIIHIHYGLEGDDLLIADLKKAFLIS